MRSTGYVAFRAIIEEEVDFTDLPDSPSSGGSGPFSFALASLQDDSTVFVSGDRNILVVPVN